MTGGGRGGGRRVSAEPGSAAPVTVAGRLSTYLRGGGIITPLITVVFAFAIGGLVVARHRPQPDQHVQGDLRGHGPDVVLPVDDRRRSGRRGAEPPADADRDRAADPHRPRGRVRVPMRPVQHRRPGPVPRRVVLRGGLGRLVVRVDAGRAAHPVRDDRGGAWPEPRGARSPALLRATTGANEVISTIMLNWIAIWLGPVPVRPRRPAAERHRHVGARVRTTSCQNAKLPVFWGDPELQGLHIGLFIALAMALVFWVILERTRTGFEVRAVGFNPEAARSAGISVGRNYVLVMAICGLFAGLAGSLDVLGWQFRVATNDIQISEIGFLGIAVALLGRNTAIGTIFAALLCGALRHRHVGAQPRPRGLRARAGRQPDDDHPGPGRAVRQRRHPGRSTCGSCARKLRRRPPADQAVQVTA